MDQGGIMLTEMGQLEKGKYHMISLRWNLKNKTKTRNRPINMDNRLGYHGWGGRGEIDEWNKEVQTANCKIKEWRYSI